jgi:cardiolipin synthase
MTYEGDATGQKFSEILLNKAAAGMDVRLMVDSYTDAILSDTYPMAVHMWREIRAERAKTRALFARMVAAGIQIQRTAPFGLLWMYGFFRDHKKMIILDNRIAYIGGINISDHNFIWHDYMCGSGLS